MTRKRIDLLLVERGLFDSRARARAAIEAGLVIAGDKVVSRPSDMMDDDADITATPAHPWVGRGGLKLDHALTLWPIVVEGRTVLDVGASTGGFTQVCLSRGAARVYAVDVGRGQLHPTLASDPRVVELSGTDARLLDSNLIPTPPDVIVTDVSFIALAKALPAALALAGEGPSWSLWSSRSSRSAASGSARADWSRTRRPGRVRSRTWSPGLKASTGGCWPRPTAPSPAATATGSSCCGR
jgi:23S rRNA (cytidine1920-2'-O)/16S rRNA (cytidine1409-2'-O)-methyltransferase